MPSRDTWQAAKPFMFVLDRRCQPLKASLTVCHGEYGISRPLFTLALGLMLVAIGIGIIRAGAQEASFESGALGLTRSEIEAEFGRIENPITVPGHPIYDETFVYELGEVTLFVTSPTVTSTGNN